MNEALTRITAMTGPWKAQRVSDSTFIQQLQREKEGERERERSIGETNVGKEEPA